MGVWVCECCARRKVDTEALEGQVATEILGNHRKRNASEVPDLRAPSHEMRHQKLHTTVQRLDPTWAAPTRMCKSYVNPHGIWFGVDGRSKEEEIVLRTRKKTAIYNLPVTWT